MHIVSDASLQRPGYRYNKHGIGFPVDAKPEIVWDHIDGPLLYFRDGQLHWLTLWERFRCWLGLDDAASIEAKRRPDLIGMCECCTEPAMIWLGDGRLFCWDHYVADAQAARAPTVSTRVEV
jgi:hypothetical protein